MRFPGFRNFLLIYTVIPVLLLTACGSDSGKKQRNTGLFSSYGVGAGDVIMIEIASPELTVNSGSSGGTGTSGGGADSGSSTGGGSGSDGTTASTGYQKTVSLEAGTTVQLSVNARDVTGTHYPNINVVWSSGDEAIATVDSTGKVTAISNGSTIITAKLTMTDGTVFTDRVWITVLSSPLNNKSWMTSTVTLPKPMWDHASTIWKGYLYVAGGHSSCDGSRDCGFTNKVYYAPLNPDGSIGTFKATTPMPKYLRGHSFVAYNDYLYIMGGIEQPIFKEPPYPDPANFQTVLNEKVYYTKVRADGGTGEWVETTPLPPSEETILPDKAGLFALSATVHDMNGTGYIYVTGGWSAEATKNVRSVFIGPLLPQDGSIPNWIHNPNSDLPYLDGLSKHVAVAGTVNEGTANEEHYLYVIGGNSGAIGVQSFHKEIYYARIANDGIPSGWAPASSSLPVPLIDHAAVSAGRYIMVLGGRDRDDNYPSYTVYPHVYYYFIKDNGDLELLNSYTIMPSPLFHHAAAADKDNATGTIHLYVTGGAIGDTGKQENRKDSVYYLSEGNP
ncbi:MAG: Ig-like domain-containing protein [Nitrospirae bacterium]|nr:Ig-like domain-containing protein [Nitrospirota bacterium]